MPNYSPYKSREDYEDAMAAQGCEPGPALRCPEPRIVDVFAEHLTGWDVEGRTYPFTRLTKGRPYDEGGTFIANEPGHIAFGAFVEIHHHGCVYRLRSVQARKAA